MADLRARSARSLLGHVTLITGAAQGIGKGIAEALLQRQSKVCLVDIKEDVGKETEDYLKQKYGDESVIFVSADVTDSEQLKGAFQNAMTRFGRLDIVVNNAGIQQERHWRKMLDINLNAVIEGTFIGTDYMRKDSGGNGGVIINVSSVGGLGPFPFKPAYVASKYGVIGFSRSWAINPDVRKNDVRVNVLCPGAVITPMQDYPDDAVYNPELCRKNDRENCGAWMTTEYLSVGFMMLVDEAVSGAVMAVTAEDGYVWTFSGGPLNSLKVIRLEAVGANNNNSSYFPVKLVSEHSKRFSDISVDSSDPDNFKYRSNRLIVDIYTNEPRRETIHLSGNMQYRYNDTHCETQPYRRAIFSQCITDDWELVGSSYLGIGDHTINFHAWRLSAPAVNLTMTVSDSCALMGLDYTGNMGTMRYARANVITGYTAGISDPSIFNLPARCSNL